MKVKLISRNPFGILDHGCAPEDVVLEFRAYVGQVELASKPPLINSP
jgi:hypothetical protein